MIIAGLLFSSAVLFYLSFPNVIAVQGASFLVWGCAFPFLWVLDGRGWRQRLILGFAWGLCAYGLLVAWLMPVSWGGWLIFTFVLSMQGVVFALFFPASSHSSVFRLFLIPSVWVFSEWARSIVLGGFTWSLGYASASCPELIQGAAWGGVYALAWAIVFVNTAVYLGVRRVVDGQGRCRLLMAAAMAVAICLILGAVRISGARASVPMFRTVAIQPNILREEKTKDELYDTNVARHFALTKKVVMAGNLGADDLVVWPETAFTDDVLTDLKWRPRLEQMARNMGVHMLVGSALLWDGHDLNSAVLLAPEGVWKGVYHKRRLVPFSEATPQGLAGMARVLGVGKYNFTAGTRPGVFAFGRHKLGVVICSEEFYPDMFRQFNRVGVDVAVVMLNDGWFERPEALLLHSLTTPVRAVESGVTVVRAANTGKTCAFDGYGRAVGRVVDLRRPGVGVYEVASAPVKTFYAKWGDVFALACTMFVIITFLAVNLRYKVNV